MTTRLLQQILGTSVRGNPGKNVIEGQQAHLSYARLDALSSQLANVLRDSGIKQKDRVGIYLDKSPEAIVAMFAILKAGAAYVPLDPDAPAGRVAYIIGNCTMSGLITSRHKAQSLKEEPLELSTLKSVVVTDLETNDSTYTPWSVVLQASPGSITLDLAETDLAYIIYTSGSTGSPKGVMISHRAALAFVDWATDYFGLQPKDRLSSHAPLHFDLSIFDIFAGVKAGATVVLVPPDLSIFPTNLADFIEQKEITVWYSVPSALTRLVLYGDLKRYEFSKLRAILFAGEVFPIKYLRQLKENIPHVSYYNLYGPTETNVCTVYPVQHMSPEQTAPLPIGRACAGCEAFTVNEQGGLSQSDEIGELCISGPPVMSGYWNLPEKTEASFIPSPKQPGVLAYRTGDLVRLDDKGNYHFTGRRDAMVKSRGYRIELGEIEAILYSHPDVQQAAVVAIPDEEFGNVLKAFIVGPTNQDDLIFFCRKRLPKYMIPDEFEFRSDLPKTSTGKIDKKQL